MSVEKETEKSAVSRPTDSESVSRKIERSRLISGLENTVDWSEDDVPKDECELDVGSMSRVSIRIEDAKKRGREANDRSQNAILRVKSVACRFDGSAVFGNDVAKDERTLSIPL